jgi:RNA polymerase sigma-70 factor, ECF subfamily
MTSTITSPFALIVSPKEVAVERDCTANGDSDTNLMVRISHRDTDALSELFHRYARFVRGIAWRVLRDTGEADDMVQDVFLLIYRDAAKFDGCKGTARFWIAQLTYHRALTRRRMLISRHSFYSGREDNPIELPDSRTANHCLEARLGTRAIKEAFDSLSGDQRQVIQLFFFDGLTLGEIAARIGETRACVKNRYFRGLDRLRRRLLTSENAEAL